MNLTRFAVAILATVAISSVALASAGSDGAWLDMKNCGNCKNMAAQTGLMEHLQWENHLLSNGLMSVTTVDPAYEEAYGRMCEVMSTNMEKAMGGAEMEMCGMCSSMMSLIKAGASMEKVDTKAGHVMLITSADEAVVAQIRTHGQRTIDEMAKMMSATETDDHAGHDH